MQTTAKGYGIWWTIVQISVLTASLTVFRLRSVNSGVHATAKYFAIMVLITENVLLKRKLISVTKYMH